MAGPAAPLTRDDHAAWLRLLEAPGVGRQSARRLLAAFGSPQAVFDAGPGAWREIAGAGIAQALMQPPPGFDTRLEHAWRWLAAAPGRAVLTVGDPAYPAALLRSPDPPLLLYAEGSLACLHAPALALVGSRHATAEGLGNARRFAADLGRAGWAVVSGLAAGIDGAAHEGALQAGADAPGTIAVLGTGLDIIYPRRHQALAARVAAHGLLLSEFAPGTPPLAANFPVRNRIIAGLSRGTLVVEAALQSGSLITARLALEAGREVYAIPGSIHSPHSRGCHALIKQGAKLVESTEDILEELGLGRAAPPPSPALPVQAELDDEPDPVLRALGWSPATLEVLQLRCGLSAPELSVRLLELELSGEVARLPGQLFQRQARG